MKTRHIESYRTEAKAIFSLINAKPDQDFHTLSSSQVDKLLEMADYDKYQKTKNANGSRARYFYQMWQRRLNAPSKLGLAEPNFFSK